MSTQRGGDLEISQDFGFQKRSWRYQRTGWVVMALLVLLALLGLLGKGPLSDARAGRSEVGLEVEFERVGRRNAPQTLRFHVASEPDPEGKISLSIDREYLESLDLRGVMPEPESVQAGPDRHTFEFVAPSGEATISFKMRPEAMGWLEGVAAIEGAPAVRFRQFVYP